MKYRKKEIEDNSIEEIEKRDRERERKLEEKKKNIALAKEQKLKKEKEDINNNKIKIIRYSASWCSICKSTKALYEKIKDNYKNDNNITFEEKDYDKDQSEFEKEGIQQMPSFIIYLNDNKVKHISGMKNKAFFDNEIENLKKRK